MHNRETIDYNNFLEDVVSDLQETLNIAKKAGISKDTIILDPGVGFAKNYEQMSPANLIQHPLKSCYNQLSLDYA